LRPIVNSRALIALLVSSALLAACGSKGPLYLPKKPAPAQSQPAPAPDPAADKKEQ